MRVDFHAGHEIVVRDSVHPAMVRLTGVMHAEVVEAAPVQQVDPADTHRAQRRDRRIARGGRFGGRFKDRIEWDVDPDGTGYVWTTSPVGHLIEFGTAQHVIRPRTRFNRQTRTTWSKPALYWHGRQFPVSQVTHPGATAQPIFRTAAYKLRGRIH
jgi:hypothetical protein